MTSQTDVMEFLLALREGDRGALNELVPMATAKRDWVVLRGWLQRERGA